MTQLEKTIIVMQLLSKRFPKLKAKELVNLAVEIVEKLSIPSSKVTNV